jgi:hypothetical protein
VGTGGGKFAVIEFDPSFGWRALERGGSRRDLSADREYRLEVVLRGQMIEVKLDGVRVVSPLMLPAPLAGSQLGAIATGSSAIRLSSFDIHAQHPNAFIVIRFGPPFDTLYRDVIEPIARKVDLKVTRADEITGPGIIFKDIQQNIAEANVVIADIATQNSNVFYEVGYAHALNKPTILLAKRGEDLPFDIKSYRVIFYDDTIGGKREIEENLERHLRSVLAGSN